LGNLVTNVSLVKFWARESYSA